MAQPRHSEPNCSQAVCATACTVREPLCVCVLPGHSLMAAPLVKPPMTLWERKLVRKPRLKTPTAVYMQATSSDSCIARWLYICCTGTSSAGGLFCGQTQSDRGRERRMGRREVKSLACHARPGVLQWKLCPLRGTASSVKANALVGSAPVPTERCCPSCAPATQRPTPVKHLRACGAHPHPHPHPLGSPTGLVMSALPGTTSLSEEEISRDVTATGPTASSLLLPKKA